MINNRLIVEPATFKDFLDRRDVGSDYNETHVLQSHTLTHVSTILQSLDPQTMSAMTIDLNAVAKNYHTLKKDINNENVVLAAVVKANAYGFGMIPVGKKLHQEGCRHFFVATVTEGIELRKHVGNDSKIFVLCGLLAGCEQTLMDNQLIPVLNSMYQVGLCTEYSQKIGKKLEAAIHVDTGMCRNGISMTEVDKYSKEISRNIALQLVVSHLACSDTPDHDLNKLQLKKFKYALGAFGNIKGSFSATNGIFLGEEYLFDMVRLGKSLYGFSIREDMVGSLEPVMDIFARIVQINEIDAGDTIGYGATFTATRKMTTATVGIGYADGFMRKFSSFGNGFIGGMKVPMVGRISMDYMVFDVTDVDNSFLKEGNWVALTRTPDYTLEKWALELGTLPHEVACRFGDRVKRVYIGGVCDPT
ncbi:alanine racemase [Alphaproteobacteria bacterium]|nr:alanine racemase [Alphaproteobacteria bacterium]